MQRSRYGHNVIQKTRVDILTINYDRQFIEGILPDQGKVVVSLWETPALFRWPKVGESWIICRSSASAPWTLSSRLTDVSTLDRDELQLDGERITDENHVELSPVGAIIGWVVDVPAGWLECDGTLASIAEYPRLYDLLGDSQGVSGDPDLFTLPEIASVGAMKYIIRT